MARIPQNIIDRVLASTDIVDLVSSYVQLKPRGSNHVGLCPFHHEKTPSFSVHRERQIFKCFGCGKGGTALTFLQEIENLTFREAIQILAQRVGVELPREEDYRKQKDPDIDRYEVMERASKQFQSWLESSGTAKDYLKGRGLQPENYQLFSIGYAPDSWSSLTEVMGKIYPFEVLQELGLIVPRGASQQGYYDRFRHRLMFPIRNTISRIVAFGGRTLGDDQAKYLNSPETSLFSKSRTLYLLDKARETCKATGYILVVEGYLDAISMHLGGFRSTVATLGTAITEEHARVLNRYTERVILMYDGDTAGIEAARRGVASFLAAGQTVDVVLLPQGEDPDSFIRKEGTMAMRRLIDKASDGFEVLLRQEVDHFGDRGAASKQAIAAVLLPILRNIPSNVVKLEYLGLLASRLSTSVEALLEDMKAQQPAPPVRPVQSQNESENKSSLLKRSDLKADELLILNFMCLLLYDSGVLTLPRPKNQEQSDDEEEQPFAGFISPEQRAQWRAEARKLVGEDDVVLPALDWALNLRAGKPLANHLQTLEESYPMLAPLVCEMLETWPPPDDPIKAAREIDAKLMNRVAQCQTDSIKSSLTAHDPNLFNDEHREFLAKLETQLHPRRKK